jgi:NADPH:quinone reductase-like Zn-dependent oxidoreductase
MDAAVIEQHGAPPTHRQYPTPRRVAGQALLRVLAAPISPLDLLCASGASYFGPPALPYVPGTQGVGRVEASERFAPGQRVWFACDAGMKPGDGSMAAYCVADETALVALPDGVADDLAAALGNSAIAAWLGLTWRGQMQPGEQVMVLGASGAVGQVAVQAAHLLGASRVIAATRDPDALAQALDHGADVTVDLKSDDVEVLTQRMVAACEGPLQLVIDPICGLPSQAAMRALASAGRLVQIGGAASPTTAMESATVRSKMLTILGYTNTAPTSEQKVRTLTTVLEHAAAGRITIDRETLPLARVGEAWQRQAAFPHHKLIVVP